MGGAASSGRCGSMRGSTCSRSAISFGARRCAPDLECGPQASRPSDEILHNELGSDWAPPGEPEEGTEIASCREPGEVQPRTTRLKRLVQHGKTVGRLDVIHRPVQVR